MNWCSSNNVRFEVTVTTYDHKPSIAIFYTLQKYVVKMTTIDDFTKCLPFLENVQLRHFLILPKVEALLAINETEHEIFVVPSISSRPQKIKRYKVEFNFRVEREFSKRHGVLVMYVHNYQTFVVYSVSKDGLLKPVYYDSELKEHGFSNQGKRLVVLKPRYAQDSLERSSLSGALVLKINLDD